MFVYYIWFCVQPDDGHIWPKHVDVLNIRLRCDETDFASFVYIIHNGDVLSKLACFCGTRTMSIANVMCIRSLVCVWAVEGFELEDFRCLWVS